MVDIAGLGARSGIGGADTGDYSRLVDRLLDPDVRLTMEERRFLADHLRGKIKRPSRGRPRSYRTRRKRREIARYVAFLQQVVGLSGHSTAIYEAALRFKCSERTVRTALSETQQDNPKAFDYFSFGKATGAAGAVWKNAAREEWLQNHISWRQENPD